MGDGADTKLPNQQEALVREVKQGDSNAYWNLSLGEIPYPFGKRIYYRNLKEVLQGMEINLNRRDQIQWRRNNANKFSVKSLHEKWKAAKMEHIYGIVI